MTETLTSQQRIFPAINTSSGELGLAVSASKYIYQNIMFKYSYMVNATKAVVPPLAANQFYFVSFQSSLDRRSDALSVCSKETIIPLSKIANPGQVFEDNPLVAMVDEKVGMIFHNPTQVISYVFSYDNYLNELPEDIMIPDPKDGQAIFLPFSTMLTTNVQQPFQLVSLKSITFFMNEEVGSVSAPVHSFTPAIAKQTARSAMDSEGATTVGSVSSISTIGTETSHMNTYHISEKIYKVVLDHTTPRVRNGRPPKASNQNPIPMAVASSSSSANISSAGSSAVDLVTANSHITGIGMLEESKPKQQSQANAKVVVKKNLQIAGYGIDLQDGKLVDESIEAKLKDGKNVFTMKWKALRENILWSYLWSRDVLGNIVENYAVPLLDSNKCEMLIKNLEYFRKDSMYLHMLQNPCLSFEWTSLWPLMMDQGWLAVDTTKDGLAVDGMDKDQKFLYAFRPNEFRNELVAGTTVFASKLAVAQYIARFPYLLQNDSTLMETLQRHGWKKNNRQQFTAPLESISRSLKDTRVHLWLHPHVLFQHYWAECGEDRILSAIALTTEEALEVDMEPSSPLVDGLSISERDRLIAEVRKISKSIAGNKCDKARSDQFVSTLSKLGWTFELAASWCKKWWKHERVLLAPYAKPNADQRKVGLDFFFCIEDAALLFAEEPEAILKATDAKSLSTYFKDKSLTNFDDGHSTLEKRIAQILMCETNPFKEFAMHEMLQDDGWQILRKQNNPIYIPKEKAQLKIKTTNLSQFSEGEDYIIGDSALVDYVTEQANLAYFKKASGEVDSEDEDGADDAETETSSSEIEDEDVEIKAEPEVVEIESDIEEKKKGKKANAQQGKKASAKKQSSSSAKASKVPSHMAENYATWTAEYKVLDDLRNNKRYFGVIYSALQVLGWKTIYDKAANGYICASWCIEYGEKLGFISGKRAIDMSQFLQNIDYFAQDSEGKDALMNYLEAYGFVRSPSYPAEASSSKDEQYRLSSRSPTRALYKATEPSEHSDRLLSEVGTTPQRMEADYFAENSPVGLSQDIDLSLLHELEDHLSSAPTFILEEQTANSDEKIKKDKELLAMLKTEPVNAGRIVSRLFRLHDWHRIYKPTNKTTYPDLDLAGCQSDVFFKPGANPADKNLIKKQDYFVTQESVVAYLQVLFGLKDVSSLTISSAEKPRRTRSGREIVCEDTEDPNSEIEDDDVMDIDQSDDKIGIVEEGEISIVSNTIPIEKYNEFAKESILDGIVLHDLGITPKTAWSKAISILMSKGWYKLNMKGHVYYFKNKLDFEKSSAKESEWRKKESVIFFTSEEQVKEYIQVKFRHEESVFSNVREKSPTSNKRYIETDTHDSSPKRSKFTEESFKNTHDTLGGYLDKAKDLLQSSTGGIITTFPVYSREDESIDLLSHVAASLCEGRGSVVYVCGGTGTGKTLSVDAVLNYVTKCKLKSKGCSDFQIVRTNGARITNMDHLMELMCEQLGKDVKFKQELKASLAIPAAPIAFGRSAYLENADLSVSQLSYSSSSSSERKSSPKSHRKKLNNFLVLIVNELDMLAPAVLRELITMATSETSSLLLIGTGNRVNAINSFDHTNRVFQVVFSAYGEDKLNNILEERAGKVFKRVAKAFLVKKVMSAQFKGDVRKLLEAASEAVNAAKGKLSMEDMNGPVKEIVEISQVKGLFESPRDKLIGSVKDFPPQLKSFLVALVLDNLADNSFTLQDALRAYNTYAVQKALSTEAPSTISSHIQTLSCYGAISIVGGKHRVSSPSKETFRLEMDAEMLLSVEGVSEADKNSLRRFAAAQRNLNNAE